MTEEAFIARLDQATRSIRITGPFSHGHGASWSLSGNIKGKAGGVFHLLAKIDRITKIFITPNSTWFEDVLVPKPGGGFFPITPTVISGSWVTAASGAWSNVAIQLSPASQARVNTYGGSVVLRRLTNKQAVIEIDDNAAPSDFHYDITLTFS